MIKKYFIGCTLIFCFLLSFFIPVCNAGFFDVTIQPSDLSINDVWLYNASVYSSDGSFTDFYMISSVDSTSEVEIDGKNYESFVINIGLEIGEYDLPSIMGIDFDFVDSIYSGCFYFAKNYNVTKSIIEGEVNFESSFSYGGKTYELYSSVEGKTVTIEKEVYNDEPDIIEKGSIWTVITKFIEIENTTTKTTYLQETNITTSNDYQTKTVTEYYECLGIETVDLDVGSFDSYKIRITYENDTNYTIRYTSSDVKNRVKETKYDVNGTVLQNYQLVSYDLGSESSEDLEMNIVVDDEVEANKNFDVTIKDESGKAIGNAIVYIENSLKPTYTDKNGVVTLKSPAEEKTYNVVAKKEGYKVSTQSFKVNASSEEENEDDNDKNKEDEEESWIPGFEIIILIIALLFLIIWKNFRKN